MLLIFQTTFIHNNILYPRKPICVFLCPKILFNFFFLMDKSNFLKNNLGVISQIAFFKISLNRHAFRLYCEIIIFLGS